MKKQVSPEASQAAARRVSGPTEHGGQLPGAAPGSGSSGRDGGCGTAVENEAPSRGISPWPLEQGPEARRPCATEGIRPCQGDRPTQYGVSYRCLLRQNQVLLTALEELQSRCASLKKENGLLRKSCFPATQEKVKHLKRKNAELAVIAKRLEERARKLQEANLKVMQVNTPVAGKGSCAGLCKKALARQRAMDLREQASALLAKDKQISALQQECCELQVKIMAGQEGPPCLPLPDFRHLLRESQKEVLRLQRQIALKNFKAVLSSRGPGEASTAVPEGFGSVLHTRSASSNGFCPSRTPLQQQRGELSFVTETASKTGPRTLPVPVRKGTAAAPEIKRQTQQLEFELGKKRKQCETLEREARKKHKRYAELEIQLQQVRGDNVRLSEENVLLRGQVEWTEKVEAENAELRLQVALVTEERDSTLQKTQELQNRLDSLGQALKHMRDVAERRQQLELEHERALQALQRKQDEVRQLQQAQAEARKEHEGAVLMLEDTLDCMQDRVRELESQCRSHKEQFYFLTQELKRFRLQAGKVGLPPSSCSVVASEVAFVSCPTPPQLLGDLPDKDPEIVPVSPRRSRKAHGEAGDGFSPAAPWHTNPAVSAMLPRSPDASAPPLASKGPAKKLESPSSSSRTESVHNSPKTCPTPELDTASEMDELDIDSISLVPEADSQSPVKLRVFLARYSYNPLDGPNENPEAELPLTAGEYIYVYGEMDEDGFFEGELMDGRRGLVPSNFVERISDEDLVTFLPQELHDLSQSSPLDRSLLSTSLSSGERSEYSTEELSTSTAPSRLDGEQEAALVPCPRKLTLIKQFGSSALVGWEPPLLPAGCPEIQSYNVYVDAELRQTVRARSQTKAVLEKLDLEEKTYCVSVQAVSEKGSSDRLRCTFLVGRDCDPAPTLLKTRSIAATSAEISWVPSNSNFLHTVYLNGEERDTTKAGVYWYTFHNLAPSTSYVATVAARPLQAPWEPSQEKREQPASAQIRFTTSSAGSPDAPLDVRVERGPSPGILVISWLPVTIDVEGSSNGVRVTGYAVYADGQKVMEVTSPTAGSVLIEASQLRNLRMCREVSIRTVSLYGESVDSVPAQIPSAFLEDAGLSPPSRLSCGEAQACLAARSSQALTTAPSSVAEHPLANFTSRPVAGAKNSAGPLHAETFSNGYSSPTEVYSARKPQALPLELEAAPREGGESLVPSAGAVSSKDLPVPREAAWEVPREDKQGVLFAAGDPALDGSGGRAGKLETSPAEQGSSEPLPEGGVESAPGPGGSWPGDSDPAEKHVPESLGKRLLDELSRDDSALVVSRVRREGEKRSEPGNRPLNLLSDHSRGSDLSDIMEEEEEEEEEEETQQPGSQREPNWNLRESRSRENGEKLDLGDSDSDSEILEQILEIPLQKNCSKALFSIPEVTEEEEEEDWESGPDTLSLSPPEKKAGDCVLGRPPLRIERVEAPVTAQAKEQISAGRGLLGPRKSFGKALEETPAGCNLSGSWDWERREKPSRPVGEGGPSLWRQASRCKEKARSRPQASQKRKAEAREHGRPSLSHFYQASGGLYRAQSLQENLDVITSIGLDDGQELCSWSRPGPPFPRSPAAQEVPHEALRGISRCPSPESSLEIDVEYDSDVDQDLTLTSSPASQLSSEGRADGSPTDCEESWSDGSSPSGGPRELKRCSSWEEESGSPSRSPGRPCHWKRATERSRSLERSPSLWRAVPEQPRKERLQARVAGDGGAQSLSSTSWQAPRRRGRRPQRRGRAGAPASPKSGSWRSPPSETSDGDSVRLFVALFDYDPVSMSPNRDAAEEELPFQEGQILKVYGPKDADGFYRGECAGRKGYIPCNMVSEVQVDGGGAREQLLREGRIPADMLVESLGNGAFSPPRQRPPARPPKPRRSKKADQERQKAENPPFGPREGQELSSEEDSPGATFGYDPKDSSLNLDVEAELKFRAGDVVTSSEDDDGLYYQHSLGCGEPAPSSLSS